MTTVAHTCPLIIGVETHARTHTYAVLAANGEHLATETFSNTHACRSRAIAWAAPISAGTSEAFGPSKTLAAARAYAERRKAEGKAPRGIRRCLKRRLYPTLNALHAPGSAVPTAA